MAAVIAIHLMGAYTPNPVTGVAKPDYLVIQNSIPWMKQVGGMVHMHVYR